MQSQSTKEIKIMVELNEAEAKWLKAFIQNYPGDPEEETCDARAYRDELFNLLKTELKK